MKECGPDSNGGRIRCRTVLGVQHNGNGIATGKTSRFHSDPSRDKSVQKFKAKVRELTVRKHNLDAKVIGKLNEVVRGTANDFGKPLFSTCRWMFQKLDSWLRMRVRSMKFKRKNDNDNGRISVRWLCRKLGLLTLEEFCRDCDHHGQARNGPPDHPMGSVGRYSPRHGATSMGVAR